MKVKFRDGLPYKQAKITFIIAFILGFVVSAVLLYVDFRRQLANVEVRMTNVSRTLAQATAKAVAEKERSLLSDIAGSLLRTEMVSKVKLFDAENNLLAESEYAPAEHRVIHKFIDSFYHDNLVYDFEVLYDDAFVGYGEVHLSTDYISKNFISNSQAVIASGFLSTVILTIVLGIVYHFTIIRRIQGIAAELSDADPETDSPCRISAHEENSKDEIGVLVSSLNRLFVRYDDAMVKIGRTEELKIAKEEADRANRLKTEFLANMSHEIRTPMNIILGFTSVLGKEIRNPEQLKLLSAVQDSGGTLMKLINDLLDLSKIESGKFDLHPSPVDMDELLTETELIFSEIISKKNIRLILEPESSKRVLMLDGIRLRQIMLNLVGNAVKFTEEGYVKIAYRTEREGKGVYSLILSVEDTGIGIDGSQIDAVFENFTQQEGQSHDKYGGTGLGLAITKKLVEVMNGEIKVVSSKGKGSNFSVKIPGVYTASVPVSDEEDSVDEVLFQPAKILIADDGENNRLLLKLLLKDQPFTFIEAANGEEAIRLAEAFLPDLIIMDMKMPFMDGYTAVKLLKENPTLSGIPVIAVTADVISERAKKALSAGCSGYVKKPVILAELIKSLQVFIKYEIKKLTSEKTESTTYGLTNEQRRIIKAELGVKWKSISRSFVMSDMEAFAVEAMRLAEAENIKDLKSWSEKLAKDVKEFDIDSLTGTIDNFTGFIKETK